MALTKQNAISCVSNPRDAKRSSCFKVMCLTRRIIGGRCVGPMFHFMPTFSQQGQKQLSISTRDQSNTSYFVWHEWIFRLCISRPFRKFTGIAVRGISPHHNTPRGSRSNRDLQGYGGWSLLARLVPAGQHAR